MNMNMMLTWRSKVIGLLLVASLGIAAIAYPLFTAGESSASTIIESQHLAGPGAGSGTGG